ncbi:unnamed protein product [Bursaphelenchus xylophilus]|nr:unnamed protein product [Bursaphelenchus xylophilus]CAG9095205.1 unnamed protein product [Bursaphelenchus xylophilus]
MSALSDFVNEYRTKSGTSSTRTFNVAHLGSNVANAFKGYLRTDLSDDTEALTDTPSTSGSMPQSRNRRLGGWFSFGNDESQCCGLSRLQRIAFFFMCIIGAAFCFGTAVLLLPMLIVNTRKFASLNTLGSVFFLISFGFLWGPIPYIQFLFTPQRRYVTAAYLSSVLATLYTSLWGAEVIG